MPNCTASTGTLTALGSVCSVRRMFTNWLGKSVSPGLSKRARTRNDPVVVSIWLSSVVRRPLASRPCSLRSQASTSRPLPAAAAIASRSAISWTSGTPKITEMGSVCTMLTSPSVVEGPIMAPTLAFRSPSRPATGAWIFV